jgi:hypothetical protein
MTGIYTGIGHSYPRAGNNLVFGEDFSPVFQPDQPIG